MSSSIRTSFLIRSLAGGLLGIFVGLAFQTEFFTTNFWVYPINLLFYMMQGVIGMGGAVVYEIERWSLLKATVVHYLSVMLFFLFMGWCLGWSGGLLYQIMPAIMTAVYFLIWIAYYIAWKIEIRQINKELKDFRRRIADTAKYKMSI